MKNNFEKIILEKIKKEKIKPIPKWFFLLKNLFFSAVFIFSILIGAVAFSILFYIFSDNYEVFELYNLEKLKYGIIFWILVLLIFIFIAVKNYKKIGNSYRYSPFIIFNWNIILSIFIGFIFFVTGVAQKTDEISNKYLSFYQKNIKITEIKKEIFLQKLKEIGITKELLETHPELKNKIEKKFDFLVLNKRYLNKNTNCSVKKIVCRDDELSFKDEKGCGCKKIYK